MQTHEYVTISNTRLGRDTILTPIEEKVCDVDMLNRRLLESHESTIKALKEMNDMLKMERGQLIDEKDDIFDKTLN